MTRLTYDEAGVSIEAGDALVERIKPLAAATRTPLVMADVGGFAGLCRLPAMREPVLVAGCDGVGTKLHIAEETGRHDSIGIDLVAMCVNDIATVGAQPLFFLDYYATGKLQVEQATSVVAGIARACKESGCALLGGETAEMPGFFPEGRYELAGFAVGVVERSAILDGKAARAGDVLIGVASQGLHSNGFSLARKALLDKGGLSLDSKPEECGGRSLGEVLLDPTRLYVRTTQLALESGGVHALCHITGGGLPGNLPRVLPKHLGVELLSASWPRPPIFDLIARVGEIDESEMLKVFNLGIGFVIVAAKEQSTTICTRLEAEGLPSWVIGQVVEADSAEDSRVRIVEG